jgi:hypothetical protein
MSFASVPREVPSLPSAASLHRVPSGSVPQLPRYYPRTPTSRAPSRVASLPSLRGTSRCASFAPSATAPLLPAWTTSSTPPAASVSTRRTQELPGSCRTLRLSAHALGPRRIAHTRPLRCSAVALRCGDSPGSAITVISGFDRIGSQFPLCTLRSRDHSRTTQHSVVGWWPTLCRHRSLTCRGPFRRFP